MSKLRAALAALRKGEMIILADDEQRENEGDFVMAAELATPAALSFMAAEARTIITLALTPERCAQLGLDLMAEHGGNAQDTAFTVTIEAARGVSTGSSARDRVRTIKAALAPKAKPADLVRPGHVFPLRAVPGGVLSRAGHTEAACDLARLAGLAPAGLISEIQLPDGRMARMPDLKKIAARHKLVLTTIADLIAYRLQKESLIRLVRSGPFATAHGRMKLHVYEDTVTGRSHVALVKGRRSRRPPLVRVMVQPNSLDYLGTSPRGSLSMPRALERLAAESHAVLLLLQVDRPAPFEAPAPERRREAKSEQRVRTYGIGAQILRDLGVRDMRLLSSPLRLPSM
ncbi:MAG: 3,4-dihydroxy-2-butanone-4-phosphate synthase, partial [Betaproteobacteria bacterium AqS2]|nr:3,4-dihydroxy-2-butanone-4-phosphate synthase [Betaproteobacteria bacterium AqS2]